MAETARAFVRCLCDAFAQLGSPSLRPLIDRSRAIYAQLGEAERLLAFDGLATALELCPDAGGDAAGMAGVWTLEQVCEAAVGLSDYLSPDPAGPQQLEQVCEAAVGLSESPQLSDPAMVQRLLTLRYKIDSPRIQVFRQFVNTPGGIKFLVDLRADLHTAMRQHPERPQWQLIDADLMHLFLSWFNPGFLKLVPINWDDTSAGQLEKLMAYDVVHPMTDWNDLRRRLEKDRLCYAFYHPNMPEEPLIFVEIALTRTIVSSIDYLFDPSKIIEDISQATTAIFYSINATQAGLSGVSLGGSLIKTVVDELLHKYPQLNRFSTLSPIPGFRDRYLEPILKRSDKAARFKLQRDQLADMFEPGGIETLQRHTGATDLADALEQLLGDSENAWTLCGELRDAVKPGLLRICEFYLTQEKRGRSPMNPVMNFHLSNGAAIYNINYLSNTMPKGLAESWGMTVNYRYDLRYIEENQELLRQGRCAESPQLRKMLQLGVSA